MNSFQQRFIRQANISLLLLGALVAFLLPGNASAQYCAPSFSTGCSIGDQISTVEFNTIVNNTGCGGAFSQPGNDYWSVYSNLSTNVNPAQSYLLTVGPGTTFSQQFGVWIDWNQDQDFQDPGEFVFNTTSSVTAGGTTNTVITVPPTAATGQTRMRVRSNWSTSLNQSDACSNTTYGEVEDYFINVLPSSDDDVGVSAIISPTSGCGLTNENVQVRVFNFGNNNQSNVDVTLVVDGTPVVTESTGATPINSGSFLDYTFSTPFNFSTFGDYDICAYTSLAADTVQLNDTSCVTITNIPVVSGTLFPYYEDFESGQGGWQSGGQNSSWAFGTPNKNTIVGAASGVNCFVNGGLTGEYNSDEQSYVESPCFDFSGLVDPVLEMDIWWEIYETSDGAAVMSSTDGGTTWELVGFFGAPGPNWYNEDNIFSNPGNQSTSPFNGWTGNDADGSGGWVPAKQDLTGLGGEPDVLLRVVFSSNTSSFTDDDGFAFDNVQIYDKPDDDVGVAEVIEPSNGCGLGTSETVSVMVANYGITPQSNFPIAFQVNGGPIQTETYPGTINPGDTLMYTFTTQFADLSTPGTNTILSFTQNPNDTVQTVNDTAPAYQIENVPTISSFPYFEDFEGGEGSWLIGGQNSSWAFGTPNKNVIVGASSGVNCFVNGGLTSEYNSEEQSWVISPCMDFSTMVDPVLEMDVWWEIWETADGAVVQASTDGGATWQLVGSVNSPDPNWYNYSSISSNPGNQPTTPYNGWSGNNGAGSNGWVSVQHDLTFLAGQSDVRIRIAFSSNNSTFTDDDGIAFDNVLIYDKPEKDVGVISVVTPLNGCSLSDTEAVTIELTNFGLQPVSNFPVSFRIDNGTVQTETYSGTINPGDTVLYTFQTQFADLSTPGTYDIDSWTSAPGDTVLLLNDSTVNHLAYHLPTISSFPYDENFESGQGGWYADQNSSWLFGSATGTNVTGTNSGVNAWTTANPTHAPSEQSAVYSPCYDFSTMGNPVIKLAVNWYTFTSTGTVLQYTTDGGQTWNNVGGVGSGFNWFNESGILGNPGGQGVGWSGSFSGNSGGWVNARNTMSNLAGQSNVQFRMAFGSWTSTTNGFAFDDVTIKEGPVVDLGPDVSLCQGDSVTLDAGSGFASYVWTTLQNTQQIQVNQSNTYIVQVQDQDGFTDRDTIEVFLSNPDVDLATTNFEACEDTSITLGVNVSGNISNIMWSTGQMDTTQVTLSAPSQTVEVVVTDTAGCQDSVSQFVEFHPLPSVNLGGNNQTVCSGETIELNADAGVPNASYLWNTGSSTQTIYISGPGTYAVTVTTPEGCTDSAQTQVQVLPTPQVELGQDVFQCENINITLDALNPGMDYLWSTGATTQTITVTQPGNYSVEVTNNLNCTGSDTVVIGQSPVINPSLPNTLESCGPASLDASDPNAVEYLWSTGQSAADITATNSGTYVVQLTDAQGCFAIDSVTVMVYEGIDAAFWAPDTVRTNTPFQLSDNSSPLADSRAWDFGDGATAGNQVSPTHEYSTPGTYTAVLTVSNGNCTDTATREIEVVQLVPIAEAVEAISVANVYPNPSVGNFHFDATFSKPLKSRIEIYDLSGRMISSYENPVAESVQRKIDLTNEGDGIYLLRLITPEGELQTKLVVY